MRDDPLGPGPLCPGCREPLRANLRSERLEAGESSGNGVGAPVSVLYFGSCGLSLHVELARPVPAAIAGEVPVAEPADPNTLEGLFQLRCRDLIAQIRELGFEPHVWVDMINDLGATAAAKALLATRTPLVATPWLASRDRSDLTLEHEISELRWADLFDEDERAEAVRRLTVALG